MRTYFRLCLSLKEQLQIAEETAENRGQLDLSVLAAQFDGDIADWRVKFKLKSGSNYPKHCRASTNFFSYGTSPDQARPAANAADRANDFKKTRLDLCAFKIPPPRYEN